MPQRVTRDEWNKLWVARVDGWVIGVAGDQHLLAQLILFPPNKVEGSLVQMTEIDLLKFKSVGMFSEELLRQTFNAEWFNYNQAGNVVRDLHIHLRPRYSKPQYFEGYTFTDEGWGHPMRFRSAEDLPDKRIVFKIVQKLRENVRNIETDMVVEIFDY